MDTPPTQSTENPYGLGALVRNGDMLSHGVLLVLGLMSFFSWYIILTKLWDQRKLRQSAKVVEKQFWTAPSVKDGVDRLKKGDDFRSIAEDGLRAASHHDGRLTDRIDLHEWITMSLQRSANNVTGKLQSGLGFLASVGSTAPFVGLFGTVVGIINALVAIGLSGQPSIDRVAGPVGEALIMTAIGLIVAVPAVLGYNWLVRRNKAVMQKVRNFSSDLHVVLLKSAKAEPGMVVAPTANVARIA